MSNLRIQQLNDVAKTDQTQRQNEVVGLFGCHAVQLCRSILPDSTPGRTQCRQEKLTSPSQVLATPHTRITNMSTVKARVNLLKKPMEKIIKTIVL